MRTADALAELLNVWPKAKDWVSHTILTELCERIARADLRTEQVRAAMASHAVEDGAHNKPKPDKLLTRLRAVKDGEAMSRRAEKVASTEDQWIVMQRRIQANSNRDAVNVPAWKIAAAWFDYEWGNKATDYEATFSAANYVASILRFYGASYNDSIYAAVAIYRIDPVELDQYAQDKIIHTKNSRLRNVKHLQNLADQAERGQKQMEEGRRCDRAEVEEVQPLFGASV